MARSLQVFGFIRFCPNCGVESIREDDYGMSKKPKQKGPSGQKAWICDTCGIGFRIIPSPRHCLANAMFKEHRVGNFMDDARNKNGTWAQEEV